MPASTHHGRLLFIDGLRGVAALMVVVYHLHEAVSEVSSRWMLPLIGGLFEYGYLGVDVFFVISGFVISYSVRSYEHTASFIFRFGLRRSIRLDPPYWITIGFELILIHAGLFLFPALLTPVPSQPQIAANMFYLQDILGFGNIVPIFWTLCYEVQFYIVFVSVLAAARKIGSLLSPKLRNAYLTAAGVIGFLWSALIFFGPLENPVSGLFLERWWQFFLGVLAMHCFTQGRGGVPFTVCTAIILIGSLFGSHDLANGFASVLIAGSIVFAGLQGRMTSWLAATPFQSLGRTSYSLYLLHTLIGWRFIKLLRVWNGSDFSPLEAWAALLAGIVLSILSARLMFLLVEGPALRFSHRVQMNRPLQPRSKAPALSK